MPSLASREIVRRAIHFQTPPRLPVSFGAFGVSDFAWFPRQDTPEERERSTAQRIDLWGCRWEATEIPNMGQLKGHPIADPHDLSGLVVPDYTDDRRYVGALEALEKAEADERYVISGIFMVLADIQSTLPTGDRQRVTEDVGLLMDHWASPQGGFIFSDYGSDAAIGVTDSGLKRFMYDEFSWRSQTLYGQPLPFPSV